MKKNMKQFTVKEAVEDCKNKIADIIGYEGFIDYIVESLVRGNRQGLRTKAGIGPLVFDCENWKDEFFIVCRIAFQNHVGKIFESPFSMNGTDENKSAESMRDAVKGFEKRIQELDGESALMESWGFKETLPYTLYEREFPMWEREAFIQVKRGQDAYGGGISMDARAFSCQAGGKEERERGTRWDGMKRNSPAPEALVSYIVKEMKFLRAVVGADSLSDTDFLAKFNAPGLMSDVLLFKAEQENGGSHEEDGE